MSTKLIPDRLAARSPAASGRAQAVPRIIYQTFETRDIAERMHEAAMTWVEMNPDYEYRFATDADRRQLIAENFEPDVVQAYDKLKNGAFRADLWRYCQLYLTGGVYADLDSTCVTPLSEVLEPEDQFVAAIAKNVPHGISNGFICATPRHRFLDQVIRDATSQIIASQGEIDGYKVVGPWALGVSVNSALKRHRKHPFQVGDNLPEPYALHLLGNIASSDELPGHLIRQAEIVLFTEYPEYQEDLKSLGVAHWMQGSMYKNRSYPRLRRFVQKMRKRFPGWI